MSTVGGRRSVVAAIVVAATLVGCGGSKSADKPGAQPDTGADSKAGLTYGYGPVRDSSITYQPDVVLLEGGPAVIRSASADGLTFTLDGDAKGVSDLAVGKIMYAAGRAVGRVETVQRAGDDAVVTVAPVQLTEVFRDAHFKIDRDISADAFLYQDTPDLPGALTVPADETSSRAASQTFVADTGLATLAVPPIRLAAAAGGGLPSANSSKVKVSVGDWEVEPYASAGKLGLKINYKAGAGLKVFVDVAFSVSKLHVRADVPISRGSVGSGSTFVVEGIKGVTASIRAGAANGGSDNKRIRVEVPVEMTIPIAGEPLVFSNKWKFAVSTALGGKNTTLKAEGEWAIKGDIGIEGGNLLLPKLSTTRSILDSISGISIGVSGLAFAVESKVQFGIGIPAAFAGPYAKVIIDLGVTNGSAFGASLARCVGATLDGRIGGGFGLSLSSAAVDALKKLLPKAKIELEAEHTESFFSKSQTLPDVPLCTGASAA
jgi:hypothetical protein